MNQDLFITGASGFVGRHLLERAACGDRRVVALTRGAIQSPPAGVEVVRVGSYGGRDELASVITAGSSVVHLAARVPGNDPKGPKGEVNSESFEASNRDLAVALAEIALACGVRRFVFLSSTHVNGRNSGDTPFVEDGEPQPFSDYARSKLEAEERLLEIGRDRGLEVVIVRCPLVYGAGVKGNFQKLIRIAQSGVPLPLKQATQNRRSYVYVETLADFLLTVADSEAGVGERFFVADGEDVSTTELLRRIARNSGAGIRLFPFPIGLLRAASRMIGKGEIAEQLFDNMQINLSKSKSYFNWAPPFSLDEGIRRTLAACARGRGQQERD